MTSAEHISDIKKQPDPLGQVSPPLSKYHYLRLSVAHFHSNDPLAVLRGFL